MAYSFKSKIFDNFSFGNRLFLAGKLHRYVLDYPRTPKSGDVKKTYHKDYHFLILDILKMAKRTSDILLLCSPDKVIICNFKYL